VTVDPYEAVREQPGVAVGHVDVAVAAPVVDADLGDREEVARPGRPLR
jgi:hypothetical protein